MANWIAFIGTVLKIVLDKTFFSIKAISENIPA
jgi:hypothetical protein